MRAYRNWVGGASPVAFTLIRRIDLLTVRPSKLLFHYVFPPYRVSHRILVRHSTGRC
jgi:hypothetical protein